MTDSQVEEVKSKTDIVSLISEYIEIKKAGRNYKANCPFHGEKTPSFIISPELQIFKCFGCGASGDAFTFLERHEGMDFGEALKYLADKSGVKLVSFKPDGDSKKEIYKQINSSAKDFYHQLLNSHTLGGKVFDYLINDRKIKKETIEEFLIGYSPESSEDLIKFLQYKKKFKTRDLVESGLILKGKYSYFDRFSGRVIFPLFDHRDNCIGFAGRLLPWDKRDSGKYINSPETTIYHKSKVLFGLNKAKKYIREKNFVIIVEGELDMISSYQSGIKNVVAIKGSALTEDQIRLLSRFCSRMILCLDSDFAGNDAAKRGAIMAVDAGFEVKVATLKDYKDPDDAVKKDLDYFKKELRNASGIWDFLIDTILVKYDLSEGLGIRNVSKEAIPVLGLIKDEIVRSHYIEYLARKLSVPVESVASEVGKSDQKINQSDYHEASPVVESRKDRKVLLERQLIAIALNTEPKTLIKADTKDLFRDRLSIKIIEEIDKYLKVNKKFDIKDFAKKLRPELSNGFSEIALSYDEREDFDLLTKELKVLKVREELVLMGNQIKEMERLGKDSEVAKLQQKFTETVKILSAL